MTGGTTHEDGTAPDRARATRRAFLARRALTLDPFQARAFDLLDEGKSVLVAAPTGSGKTLVAEYAVARALGEGGRAIYTTPLKALSNQKYADFAAEYGTARVGLLTGDVSRNGDAAIVVMTTEVLRNMIYADAARLADLRCVVLDEVHYLEDRYRGSVWEEIILSAPPEVVLVCLSATVSNAEELAGWIEQVRGSTAHVIEERRPIELRHLYVLGIRATHRLEILPTFVDGTPNPEAIALDARSRPPARAGVTAARAGRPVARSPVFRPRRAEVVERFAEEDLLPAIYFVFSRAGCDDAVRQCLEAGLRLTTPEERRVIRTVVDDHVEALSDADLRVLGYGRFVEGLEAGFAPHHAGLVPPFREAVEALFGAAIVKVVFATETLALGINMPARSVIIESLSKFSGTRARGPHGRELHPAHRARRAPGHRPDRPRRGALVALPHLRRGLRASPRPAAAPCAARSARPTTWRSTSSGATHPTTPTGSCARRSPSTSPRCRSRASSTPSSACSPPAATWRDGG